MATAKMTSRAPSIDQQEQILSKRFVQVCRRSEQSLGTKNLTLAGSTQILLNNVGALEKLRLGFTFTFNTSATAVAAPFSWLNIVTNIMLTDFNNLPRINATAKGIWLAMALQNQYAPGLIAGQSAGLGASVAGLQPYGKPGFNNPLIGLATGSTQTATAYLDIPVCMDEAHGDIRGIIALQNNTGQATLNITLANTWGASGDDTKMFNGAATITPVSATVEVTQVFRLLQSDPVTLQMVQSGQISPVYAPQGVPMPPISFNTVREIVSSSVSANIAANQELQINLPNGRFIDSILYDFVNNSALGGAGSTFPTTNDILLHRLIFQGANPVITRDAWMQYMYQREQLGYDLGLGTYFMDFIGKKGFGGQPIYTKETGGVILGLTPQTNNGGNTAVNVTYTSTYPLGSDLGTVSAQSA